MKKYFHALLLMAAFFTAVIYTGDCYADNAVSAEPEDESRWGIGAHPIIGYDNDSSLTLGAAAVIYFKPEDDSRDTDEIAFVTSCNLAKQYDVMVEYSKYFKNNFCIIDGSFGYQNYPDDYMGEDYDAVYYPFVIGAAFKIYKEIYMGPLYSFKYSNAGFINDKIVQVSWQDSYTHCSCREYCQAA